MFTGLICNLHTADVGYKKPPAVSESNPSRLTSVEFAKSLMRVFAINTGVEINFECYKNKSARNSDAR